MKKLLSILFFCGVALCAYSDEVEFKASAPPQVIVGKPFKLTYTINQSAKDLRVPELSDFDYVAGPSQAVSSMNSFTNGTRTSSYTLSITYVLVANREGDHNIPAATIKVDGKQYYSNGLKIKVYLLTSRPVMLSPIMHPIKIKVAISLSERWFLKLLYMNKRRYC